MAPAIDLKALPNGLAIGARVLLGLNFENQFLSFVSSDISVNELVASVQVTVAVAVTVDWGDGAVETVSPTGSKVVGSHTYASPGVRTVTLSGPVTASKKINAGVVPTSAVTVYHNPALPTGDNYSYQRAQQPSGKHQAGTSWNEATAFCDGVLRQHLWLDLDHPDPSFRSGFVAYDVSFGGSWWDISGSDQVLSLNNTPPKHPFRYLETNSDYGMFGQLPYPAGKAALDIGSAATVENEPTTGKVFLDPGVDWRPTLLVMPDGRLVSISGNTESYTDGASLNVDNVLNASTDPGVAAGAWPAGFDLEMIPVILP
jgi:hypothetical protein